MVRSIQIPPWISVAHLLIASDQDPPLLDRFGTIMTAGPDGESAPREPDGEAWLHRCGRLGEEDLAPDTHTDSEGQGVNSRVRAPILSRSIALRPSAWPCSDS